MAVGGRRGRRPGGLRARAGEPAGAQPTSCRCPDELLAVAVWVGEAGTSGAPVDQVHEREEGRIRGRERRPPAGRRAGRAPARPALGGGRPGPLGPRGGRARPRDARRQARRRQRRRGDRARPALGGRRRARASSRRRESRIPRRCAPTSRRRGRDGDVRRLRRPLRPRDADPGARRAHAPRGRRRSRTRASAPSSTSSARNYAGRPTPLTRAERFAPDQRLYLKREDLLHTGAHKLNNALGQAVLARRLGKQRIVAETGAGQHGVATATVCARFGLDCVVYMGAEDMRRQKPNVERMGLLGAEVRPVEFGTKTLKEATSEAIRDWITNVETTHYLIGSCVGPAPYPAIVRELQAVIGRETRDADPRGRGPAAGRRGRVRRRRLERDRDVRRLPRRRGRRDRRRRGGRRGEPRHRPCRRPPRLALVGARRRGRADRRRALDLGRPRLPGVGPEHAHLRDTGRARYVGTTDDEALDAFRRLTRTEGIIPALEPSHALARVAELDAELVVVCLSGRGDKDLAEVLAR